MDLNPVIVTERLTVVDARVVLRSARLTGAVEDLPDESAGGVEHFLRPLAVRRVAAAREEKRPGRAANPRHDRPRPAFTVPYSSSSPG